MCYAVNALTIVGGFAVLVLLAVGIYLLIGAVVHHFTYDFVKLDGCIEEMLNRYNDLSTRITNLEAKESATERVKD